MLRCRSIAGMQNTGHGCLLRGAPGCRAAVLRLCLDDTPPLAEHRARPFAFEHRQGTTRGIDLLVGAKLLNNHQEASANATKDGMLRLQHGCHNCADQAKLRDTVQVMAAAAASAIEQDHQHVVRALVRRIPAGLRLYPCSQAGTCKPQSSEERPVPGACLHIPTKPEGGGRAGTTVWRPRNATRQTGL